MLNDIPTVLKMFRETIKWMWIVVEEWSKSDGNDMMQVDEKRMHIECWDLQMHGKPFSVGLVWMFNDTKNKTYSSTSLLTPRGSGLESCPSKCKF